MQLYLALVRWESILSRKLSPKQNVYLPNKLHEWTIKWLILEYLLRVFRVHLVLPYSQEKNEKCRLNTASTRLVHKFMLLVHNCGRQKPAACPSIYCRFLDPVWNKHLWCQLHEHVPRQKSSNNIKHLIFDLRRDWLKTAQPDFYDHRIPGDWDCTTRP